MTIYRNGLKHEETNTTYIIERSKDTADWRR